MMSAIPILSRNNPVFPDPDLALPDGLVAIGGNLNTDTLQDAYSRGIFPWYEEGLPILWYSPDPRLILYPEKLNVSKSLRNSLRKFDIRFNTSFREVMEYCASVRREGQRGTWITEEMNDAYTELNLLGIAYSVETFFEGKLVGGLYGVISGGIFVGESMFHIMRDASKAALFSLCEIAQKSDFDFIDCQTETDHLLSMGAECISRSNYLELLRKSVQKGEKKIIGLY